MLAMQTLLSASLVVALLGSTARAQGAPDSGQHGDDGALLDPPPPTQPSGVFQIGAGYNSDDGFLFTSRIAQSNLFGTGDQLALSSFVSGRRQLFDLHFADPHVFDSDLVFAVDLYNAQRQLPGFTRDAAGITPTLATALGDHVRAFVGLRIEQVSNTGDPIDVSARGDDTAVPPLLRDLDLVSLRAGVAYSTLSAPVMALRGSSVGATLEVADPRLGSSIALARVNAWASTNQGIGPFTLHLGASFASVTGPDGVPLSERLFLDGSSELRGYAPGALGPIDLLTGTPIGGNYELLGHASLELPVFRSLGLGVEGFADVGAIYDATGAGQLGRSTGFGVVWRSPLGPMRLDLAFPLGGKPTFVFGLGP